MIDAKTMKTDQLYYYVDFLEGDLNHVSRGDWFESESPDEFCNYVNSLGLAFTDYEEAAIVAEKMINVIKEKSTR